MKRLLLIATVVLVALGTLLYVLVGTEPGLRWLAARVTARLPAGSRFDEISGHLLGPIEVANMRLVGGGYVVEIGRARIEWTPASLLHSSVHLSQVQASDVRVQRAVQRESATEASPLPVSVQIDALRIERLDILPSPASEPIRLDLLALAGALDADGIAVHSLQARGMGAHAEGEISFGTATPLSARIAWDYAPAGLPSLAGELRARGQGDVIALEQSLSPPYSAHFQGTLDPHARRVQGRWSIDALSLDSVRTDWPTLAIQATADVDGTLDALTAELSGTLTPAGGTPIDVSAKLAANRDQLTITHARVQMSDIAFEGQGHASLRALREGMDPAQLPIVLDLSALDVAVPQFGHIRGEAHLSGTFARHELRAQGQLETPLSVKGSWKLAARGESRTLTIDELTAELANGTANARGTLDWGASLDSQLQTSIRGADPGVIWRDAAGRLDADGNLAVQTATHSFSFRLDSLSGRLRGQPVSGQGSVRFADGTWRIDALELAAGDAHLSASGEIAERARLSWSLDAPELNRAIPGWSGSLRGSGRISGASAAPQFEGELDGQGLSILGMNAAAVQGNWSIDLSGRVPSRVHVTGDAMVVGGRHLDSVRIEGSGPIGQHTLELAIESANTHAALRFGGGWKGNAWRGQLERAELEAPATSRWTLTEPAPILLSPDRLQVDRTCLHQGQSQSCVRLEWRAPRIWALETTLEDMPLAALAPLLPAALGYQGLVAGEADLKGNGRMMTSAAADLTFDPGTITQGDPPLRVLGWKRVHAQAQLARDQLDVKSTVELADDVGQVSLEASLLSADLLQIARAPIKGRIAGLLLNVPLITALSPDLSELRGETRLDLRIAGTLLQPEIYGDASIQNGAAAVPRLGISLHDVRLALRGDGRTLELDGEAQSGAGKVVFTGALEPGPDGWQGTASISGQDFRLLELPEITGDISPDVRLALNGRTLHVEGDVSVPRANVAPRDLAGAVRASPDAVVVGPSAQSQGQSPWQLDAQLRIILGAGVTFHGFGLDADIGGSVVATDRPGLPTTGTGELNVVQGTYTAYGRRLTIDHGRLLFNGGLIDNPALDARASRHLESQHVGVDVRGTLRKPELRLYSDPPLSQTDALAYLLIGRPVGSLSSGEQAELADTTRQIGLSGAGFFAQQVGRRIGTEVGIEEVGIGDENREERTALFIGRYLSPKLYVGYGVGLFETVNTWRVRYFLTPRLLLQAESGTEHSADVIYSIDR